jgi:hypothetical protein
VGPLAPSGSTSSYAPPQLPADNLPPGGADRRPPHGGHRPGLGGVSRPRTQPIAAQASGRPPRPKPRCGIRHGAKWRAPPTSAIYAPARPRGTAWNATFDRTPPWSRWYSAAGDGRAVRPYGLLDARPAADDRRTEHTVRRSSEMERAACLLGSARSARHGDGATRGIRCGVSGEAARRGGRRSAAPERGKPQRKGGRADRRQPRSGAGDDGTATGNPHAAGG